MVSVSGCLLGVDPSIFDRPFVSRIRVFSLFQVLNICNRIMDELIPNDRADRDFRVKFPDDVMQDNLAGQLWFGAEVNNLHS